MEKAKFEIYKFRDGGLLLSFGGDQVFDLVFSSGACDSCDPDFKKQLDHLEMMVKALNAQC